MNEFVRYALAFVGGMLLAALFYGGLWWTVRRALGSRNPALWFAASLLARTAAAAAGIAYFATGGWKNSALCLLGFVAVRFVAVTLAGLPDREREAGNAPQP